MSRIRSVLLLMVLLLAPARAYAYGEIFLYPFGALLATAVVFVFSLFRPYRWWMRIAACVASLLAPILALKVFDVLLPPSLRISQIHLFTAGFFPSLIAGAATAFLLHRWRSRIKPARPQSRGEAR